MSTLEPRPTPSRTPSGSRAPAGLRVAPIDVDEATERDPWRLLSHVDEIEPWFAWYDGYRDTCFLAVGAAATWSAPVATPLAGLLPRRSQLHEQLMGFPEAPLWLGGRAFHDVDPDSPWAGLPAAHLRVPRWLAYRRGAVAGALAVQPAGTPLPRLTPRPPPSGRAASPHWSSQPDAEGYQRGVERAVAAMDARPLRKVVLSRAAVAESEGRFDPRATLLALRARQPRAIVFGMGFGDARAFVGATPETLARVHEGCFETQAVAGTAPLEAAPAGLLASAKDRHEHDLVVRGIVEALRPVARSIQHEDTPEVVAAGQIRHLVTPISAHLASGYGLLEAVDRLHPTPALCGTPREAARAYILAHEGIDRGWYGGPIGWTSPNGDGTFAVAIRSALLEGARARAFVGAGLVAASDPVREWAETEQKLTTLASALRVREERRA